MNCWRGTCKYRTDDGCCMFDGLCCDIERVGGSGARYHTCHYEREHDEFKLTCSNACYSYGWCEVI